MRNGSQDNPMTEIALALATGFFSIMILTMVSMGAGFRESKPASALVLPPAAADAPSSATVAPDRKDIIIFHQGRFLDADLKAIDPAAVRFRDRLVLAVDPSLSLGRVMEARIRLAAPNLIVSTLDARWMAALQRAAR